MQVPASSNSANSSRRTEHQTQQHFWDRQMLASDSRIKNSSSTHSDLAKAGHTHSTPFIPASAIRRDHPLQSSNSPPPPATNVHQAHADQPVRQPSSQARPPSESTFLFSNKPPVGEAVQLFDNETEKDRLEDMSALFSLITTTERLENIWARRGALSKDDYEHHCETLIQSYNALRPALDKYVPNIDMFIAEYDCKASKARSRLQAGVPATVQVTGAGTAKAKDRERAVMRCTGLFHEITTAIDLKQLAKFFLLPSLTSLMKMLNVLSTQNDNLEINTKLRKWVEKLNNMQPYEQLSEEEGTQLKMDLELGFYDFENLCN